jgi:voltage-gated potassium channel
MLTKAYHGLILVLSIYVIGQLLMELVLDLSPATLNVLAWVDASIASLFLLDWFVFFVRSERKGEYLKTRWVDLIASIPFTQVLRPLRIFRVLRLARTLKVIRGLRGAVPILRTVTANPARSALTVYLSVTVVVYVYCSIGLYTFEKAANEQISGFPDVLWMAFTTITTVGYGDIYPVTGGGRIMAAILVLTGMGLLALLTAEIATFILRRFGQSDDTPQ